MRQEIKDRKFIPLVIDICDEFSLFAKQKIKRLNFYKKNNYNIAFYDIDDNKLNIEVYKSKKNKKYGSGATGTTQEVELDFLPD